MMNHIVSLALLSVGLLHPSQASGATEEGRGLRGSRLRACPLTFIENRGQRRESVRFLARRQALVAHFERDGIALQLRRPGVKDRTEIRLSFAGAGTRATIEGEGRQEGIHNFFLGDDSSRWRRRVPGYSRLLYRGLYEGISVRCREGAGGFIEYDLLLKPGADLSRVAIRCDGIDGLETTADGSLLLHTEIGVLRQAPPATWQVLPSGERQPVECRYVELDKTTYGFEAPGRDTGLSLVVDPRLEWSSFIGGSLLDSSEAIAVDNAPAEPEILVAGFTEGGFPTCAERQVQGDCVDPIHGGGQDGFVARLKADGTELISLAYLGGTSKDILHSLVVNDQGEPIVTGYNWSFPVPNELRDRVWSPDLNGENDIFVVRLSPMLDEITYATHIGGSDRDVATDMGPYGEDAVCITGCTLSTDFPTRNAFPGRAESDVLQPEKGGTAGNWDAFVCILKPDPALPVAEQLVYSTYLGGTGSEGFVDDFPTRKNGRDITADQAGIVTVVGHTTSVDFPVTANALQESHGGGPDGYDGFVTRINPREPAAGQLVYSTYLGGNRNDFPTLVRMHGADRIYVAGATYSPDFPASGEGAFQGEHNGFPEPESTDSFLLVLGQVGEPGSPEIWQLRYATFFGGETHETPWDMGVDAAGVATLGGWTRSRSFPVTNDAIQAALASPPDVVSRDGFLLRLNPDLGLPPGEQLAYATFLGGSKSDAITALAQVDDCDVVVAGFTYSGDLADPSWPTTAGAFQEQYDGGETDGFVARLRLCEPPDSPLFIRMDLHPLDAPDGKLGLTDVIWLLASFLFGQDKTMNCPDAADANDDGKIGLTDAIYMLSYLFLPEGSKPPVKPPFGPLPDGCGVDPTADELDEQSAKSEHGKKCYYPSCP